MPGSIKGGSGGGGSGDMLSTNNLSDVASTTAAAHNIGLGTADSPQFTAVNIGHATNTTLAQTAAGKIAVEGKAVPLSAGAADITFTGPAAARTYTLPDADATIITSGGALGTPASGTLTNATGLPAGGLTATATDKVFGRSTVGGGAGEEITCTAAGRALIDDATAGDQRTTLGLGTMATQAASGVAITGGTIAGLTTLEAVPTNTPASNKVSFLCATENIAVGNGVPTQDGTAGFIPAGALVVAARFEVLVQPGGTATYSAGTSSQPSALLPSTPTTVGVAMGAALVSAAVGDAMVWLPTSIAKTVTLTFNTNTTDGNGSIKVSIWYFLPTIA